MSTLTEADHARLRRAEQSWLAQCAERLRRNAPARRAPAVPAEAPAPRRQQEATR